MLKTACRGMHGSGGNQEEGVCVCARHSLCVKCVVSGVRLVCG